MGNGTVWDDEAPAAPRGRGTIWDDETVPVATESNPTPVAAKPAPIGGAPTQTGAGFRAFVGGSLQNFADEAAGKTYEAGSYLRNLINGLGTDEAESRRTDDYRHGRDTTRQVQAQDREAFPKTVIGTGMLGDATSQAVMAAGTLGASLTPGGMAITGGLSGLGASEADLTRGEYGRAALDTGTGASFGYGLGKAGDIVTPSAKGFIRRRIGRATGDAAAEVERKASQALGGGISKVGAETSAARNALEVAREILSSPHATPKQLATAKAIMDSPESVALLRGVYDNTLERLPSRLGGIETARTALDPLRGAASPAGITAATEERLSGAGRRIASRWPHAVNKLLPIATTAIGASVGDGPEGAALGAGLGLGASLVMGRGGTVAANLMRDPAIRRAAWKATETALKAGGAVLGKFGPFLAREYQRNPAYARAIDEALMSEEPEYAARKLELFQGSSP